MVTPAHVLERFSGNVKSTGQMYQVGDVTYAAYWSEDTWVGGRGEDQHMPSMPNLVRLNGTTLVFSLLTHLDYQLGLARIALMIADIDQWMPLSLPIYEVLSHNEFGIAAEPPDLM